MADDAMKIKVISFEIDREADAGYIYFSKNAVASTQEVTPTVLVDLDEFGIVVGIEVLQLSAQIPLDRLERDFHIHSNVQFVFKALRAPKHTSKGHDGHSKLTQEVDSSALVFA